MNDAPFISFFFFFPFFFLTKLALQEKMTELKQGRPLLVRVTRIRVRVGEEGEGLEKGVFIIKRNK